MLQTNLKVNIHHQCTFVLTELISLCLSFSPSLLLPLPAILVPLPFPQAPRCARISGCIWVSASHPAQWTANFSRSSERTCTSVLYLVSPVLCFSSCLRYTVSLYIHCLYISCLFMSFKPPEQLMVPMLSFVHILYVSCLSRIFPVDFHCAHKINLSRPTSLKLLTSLIPW